MGRTFEPAFGLTGVLRFSLTRQGCEKGRTPHELGRKPRGRIGIANFLLRTPMCSPHGAARPPQFRGRIGKGYYPPAHRQPAPAHVEVEAIWRFVVMEHYRDVVNRICRASFQGVS